MRGLVPESKVPQQSLWSIPGWASLAGLLEEVEAKAVNVPTGFNELPVGQT